MQRLNTLCCLRVYLSLRRLVARTSAEFFFFFIGSMLRSLTHGVADMDRLSCKWLASLVITAVSLQLKDRSCQRGKILSSKLSGTENKKRIGLSFSRFISLVFWENIYIYIFLWVTDFKIWALYCPLVDDRLRLHQLSFYLGTIPASLRHTKKYDGKRHLVFNCVSLQSCITWNCMHAVCHVG